MIQTTQGEGLRFRLKQAKEVKAWLTHVAHLRGFEISRIGIVWMNDAALRAMNVTYLQHDYETDIITFDYSGASSPLSGELYISIDRVKAHAKEYGISFQEELHRVMVHGLLHLMGLSDENDADKAAMRQAENWALSERNWAFK